MKSDRKYLNLAIATIACVMVVCAAKVALGAQEVNSDTPLKSNADATSTKHASSSVSDTADSVSVYLGKYHLIIPRAYFASGPFSVQTTNHLVLDMELPDVRPLTDAERKQFATTGLVSPNTVHIILEVRDKDYIYGDRLLERFTRDGTSSTPPFHYLSSEQSDQPNMVVFHNRRFDRDVYLVKDSSPKFFFDCSMPNKFIVKPDCKYYGQLVGGIRFQIWYDKNHYINEIVPLTPKIKAKLLSFVVP